MVLETMLYSLYLSCFEERFIMKKIIVDTGCDYKFLETDNPNIGYAQVPFKINVGERVYVDDVNLNIEEMIADLRSSKEKSGSACPSPYNYLEAFGNADEIYVFTISGPMSGSNNSAVLAAEMYKRENPGVKIYVMDTLSIGGTMCLLVDKTLEWLERDLPFETVCANIEEYRKRVEVVFMLDNIDNLVNNGRMCKVAGLAVNLLGINIMLSASDIGHVEILGKSRGTAKCLQNIYKQMKKYGYNGGKVVVAYSENRLAADKMCKIIKSNYPNVEIKSVKMCGLCCYYSYITGLMVGFEHD